MLPDSEYARFDFTLNYIHREMADHAALPWIAAGRRRPSMADVWASGLSSSPLGPVSLDEARLSAFAALEMPQWGAWDHKPRLEAELGLNGDPDDPADDDYYYAIRGNTTDELYYDVWSNIHYGYVGMSAGFSADLIRLGHQLESAGSFDEADVLSVEIGIELWQTYGTNLTAEHLHQPILANIETYRQIREQHGAKVLTDLVIGEN